MKLNKNKPLKKPRKSMNKKFNKNHKMIKNVLNGIIRCGKESQTMRRHNLLIVESQHVHHAIKIRQKMKICKHPVVTHP